MSPQTSGQTSSSEKLVPFRWPPTWADPSLLKLVVGSPINCLLIEALAGVKPMAEAASAAGFAVFEWSALGAAPLAEVNWKSGAAQTAITGLPWPRIKISGGTSGDVAAGPTGAPWIDSNTWVSRLARVRAPQRPVWLGFEVAKGDPVPTESAYTVAVADSAAAGARWMVSLDDWLSKGLAAGNVDGLKVWGSILGALAFFERHRGWAEWAPSGPIGILSTFAGKDEFIGQEVLNRAARRNLLYRVLDRSTQASQTLKGLRAVLYVDNDSPSAELKARLGAFARAGGLLIVPHSLASEFDGEKAIECAVAGYELRSLGKGSVAAATRDWDDPYFLAADIHNLVGRRNDPVTLFNARSLWEHYCEAPDGRQALLQLVAFTSRPNESVSVAPSRPWRSAAMYRIGAEAPAIVEPVEVDRKPEFHLPAFSYYAALEFQS